MWHFFQLPAASQNIAVGGNCSIGIRDHVVMKMRRPLVTEERVRRPNRGGHVLADEADGLLGGVER